MSDTTARGALVFGARNLGRAVIETLVEQGWRVAGAARSDESLANVTAAGALALRARGIHVALLIVDAGIEPYAGGGRPGVDPEALADPRRVADAVVFLAEQGPRAATHELQVTPLAETWVP